MNELQKRLAKCKGRFLYFESGTSANGAWNDKRIAFYDPPSHTPTSVTIPAAPNPGSSRVWGPVGWAQVLALILCLNGRSIGRDFVNGTNPIDNVLTVSGKTYGAHNIRYIPGVAVQWWAKRGLTGDDYLQYSFPSNLDSIITSDGSVVDPAALLMLLAVTTKLTPRTCTGVSYNQGVDMPWIGFELLNGDLKLVQSTYDNNANPKLAWTTQATPSTAQVLVATINAAFPCDFDTLGLVYGAYFSCYGNLSRFIPQIQMKDVDDITQLVAGAMEHEATFIMERYENTCNVGMRVNAWSTCAHDPERDPYAADLEASLNGISSGILALQETLATVQGGVSDANTGIGGISDQVGGVATDVEAAKQAVLTAIGTLDIDLSPIQTQIEQVFSQASVDSQIVAAMAIKIAIGKLPKRLRTTLLDALRNMRYDQGALPEYAGQYGGAINLYDMLFDSNGKPTFTQEAPDGSDTQH